jgi:hypothetical protein
MRKMLLFTTVALLATCIVFFVESCSKALSSSTSATITTSGSTSTSSTITVSLDSSGTDSVYIIQSCANGYYRDSIAATSLPASIKSYLDSGYNGFSLLKAFVIKDSAGTIGGYVVIINYDGKPVALLFNAGGTFQRVLEQVQLGDINGNGWHEGGRYGDRDGLGKDSVALKALPASITTYMSFNYPNDTLENAYINIDSSYVVISEDNGLYATLFSSSGSFVKRVAIPSPDNNVQLVARDSLPATALSYLSNTYPGFVFDKAFSYSANGVVQGYIMVIDANSTKYAVEFDAAGNFILAITIW